MAKTKTGGKTTQKATRPGQRLGIKIYGGKRVKIGEIIVRQRGTVYHSGEGTGLGRDHTIFALKAGEVKFFDRHGKKIIQVV